MATYAISDLHGHLEIYKQIKAMLKPGDIVYCLGDCGDRGPRPWETIKAVYNDPQFIYLKGNHEDMLVDAMIEYLDYGNDIPHDHWDDYARRLLFANGGERTLREWRIEEKANREWIDKLNKLPITAEYTNEEGVTFKMSHAGFTPRTTEEPSEHNLIWGRKHFAADWPKDKEFENVVVLHGHTPIPYCFTRDEDDFEPGACYYCHGHKINIDNGGFFTNYFCLFDLDTYDEHIFVEDEED
jgi:predicted phosphodiesterase